MLPEVVEHSVSESGAASGGGIDVGRRAPMASDSRGARGAGATLALTPAQGDIGHRVASLKDRWLALRDRLLGDPAFHRWARRNWITRIIARRRARQVFDLCAGFVYSQTLSACVELDLFRLLGKQPRSAEHIARSTGIDRPAMEALLRAAVSLRLLQRRAAGHYGLGVHGAAILANPGLMTMIEHHAFFYRDLTDPVALLRGEQAKTHLSLFWDYADTAGEGTRSAAGQQLYTQLMSASQAMIAEQLLDVYPIREHQRLLDVGGGDGTFLSIVADRTPDIALMLFDLPSVVRNSASTHRRRPGSPAIERFCGNMFTDPLPEGADVISLIRIVHDHGDDEALALLRQCHRALPAGGTLLLAEPMARERVGDPASDAYFGWYLHAMGQGRPRTRRELEELLVQAGFSRVSEARTHLPMLVRLLVARA